MNCIYDIKTLKNIYYCEVEYVKLNLVIVKNRNVDNSSIRQMSFLVRKRQKIHHFLHITAKRFATTDFNYFL